jgi:hypothetical protein
MNKPICLSRTQSIGVVDTAQMHQTLIVLIPPGLDTSLLSHQIWKLANATRMHVLLLSLAGDEANEPGLRRGMVTLAAMLQGGRIPTDMRIEAGVNWVDIVKLHYCPGDMIVCPDGYRIGIFHRSLRQILEAKLNAPTYVLSMPNARKENPNWKSEIMAWSGFIGLLSGFGFLQFEIVNSIQGGFQTILLLLSTILEFWLFLVWSNLVG